MKSFPTTSLCICIALTIATPLTLGNWTFEVAVNDLGVYEQEILAEFREAVQDLATPDFMKVDAYLLRWLKAADFNLPEAVQWFMKSLAWRSGNNVDNVLFENFTFIEEKYPILVDGVDKNGRPLAFTKMGTFDFRKIAVSGNEALYQRYAIWMLELYEEYLHLLRETTGHKNLTNVVTIHDLNGDNINRGACLQCLKMLPEFISNYEFNYPGVYYRVYFINTPAIFHKAFRIAQNFMSESTKEAVQVYDFDKAKWSAELLQQIPADQLPTQFGGAKELKLGKGSIFKTRGVLQMFRDRYQSKSKTKSAEVKELVLTMNEQELELESTLVLKNEHEHHHHYRKLDEKTSEKMVVENMTPHGPGLKNIKSRSYADDQTDTGATPVNASSSISGGLAPYLSKSETLGLVYIIASFCI